jgi:glycosyltransferase involved in cell wall biosynthesis
MQAMPRCDVLSLNMPHDASILVCWLFFCTLVCITFAQQKGICSLFVAVLILYIIMPEASKKILFVVHHRLGRSPGQRFRFEQYIGALQQAGFQIEISNILSQADDKIFYSKGRYAAKAAIVFKSFFHRLADISKARNAYAVFVYREAYMLGTVLFESLLAQTGTPMVFDFDDSIWLNDTSDGNKNLSWLKKPSKTGQIARMAKAVIVGNSYLASYAQGFSANVHIVPTTIDTTYHKPLPKAADRLKPVCIGWTGTSTTLKHFASLENVLAQLYGMYGSRICFTLISDTRYESRLFPINWVQWEASSEIEQLCQIDIGIMPLPDDQWAKGKCGFKGLQYMALEIPAVMSPVGVNKDIICHGQNGMLASGGQEWIQCLSMLINDAELRKLMGKRGRQTVIDNYSVESQAGNYVDIFKSLRTN